MPETQLPRRSGATCAVILLAVVVGALVLLVGPLATTRWGVITTWATALLLLGWALHRNRADRHRYEQSLQWIGAQQARAEQRLDLARRLHDRLSGHLGAITMQSSIALRSPRALPADDALATIEDTSRTATAELRAVLSELREPIPGDLAPAQERITDALTEARARGVDVTFAQAPDIPEPLLAPLATVVVEGLLNIHRHCGPTDARVRLLQDDEAALAVIEDDGPTEPHTPVPGTGFGLTGLQELVAVHGGRIDAGPREDSAGWRLRCRIPSQDQDHR